MPELCPKNTWPRFAVFAAAAGCDYAHITQLPTMTILLKLIHSLGTALTEKRTLRLQ
jgi:hypothetical protein